jgi:hypothetical protein
MSFIQGVELLRSKIFNLLDWWSKILEVGVETLMVGAPFTKLLFTEIEVPL